MRTVNPFKAGLGIGLAVGLFHLCWAALVASGWAQPVMDFILRLHFIAPFMTIQPFDAVIAAELVGLTAGLGFVGGFVLGLIWNGLNPGPWK